MGRRHSNQTPCARCGQPCKDEKNTRYCSWTCRYPAAHEKFWSHVAKGADTECWLWTGPINPGGYGVLATREGPARAHRYSYRLAYGEIPHSDGWHGVCVLHRCDTPLCVNPAHLFLGTQKDNVQDMLRKGRQHFPRGVDAGQAKLTEAAVRAIRESNESQSTLAARYGVIQAHISRIKRRVVWAHL